MPGVCTSMLSGVSAIGPQVWATDDTFHDGVRRAGKTKFQWGRSFGPARDWSGDAPDSLPPVKSAKKYHIPRRAINTFTSKIFLLHPLSFPPLFW